MTGSLARLGGVLGDEQTMEESRGDRRWTRSRSMLVLLIFLGVAGFFLITEHTAHVFGALPYVLLLACPLMHFLHRGHRGGHGGHGRPPPAEETRR
jgi:hypothetical protein